MTVTITAIGLPFFFISFFVQRYSGLNLSWFVSVVLIFIYLSKDFFRAKSIAKRLIGLQVIDQKTNLPASRLKCFIRNITVVIWPIEVVVTLGSTHRKLGDVLANTRVEQSNKEPIESLIKEIKDYFKMP
jgi:hypothetical protein